MTPNLLARTIETVEGGGIIVLLLSTLQSLTQLYSLTMDVHARFRTQSHQEVAGRPPVSRALSKTEHWAHDPQDPVPAKAPCLKRLQAQLGA